MNLKAEWTTDVLVMGAGLSGIMAAISAAEAGARVIITSSTKICSGSSFYPGTWGLGLVGPESQEDETDLIGTILRVGEGMADPKLVTAFVSDIREGIQYLKDMGVKLKQTDAGAEKEFIPCFGHKHRNWNGFIKQEAEEIFLDKDEETRNTDAFRDRNYKAGETGGHCMRCRCIEKERRTSIYCSWKCCDCVWRHRRAF